MPTASLMARPNLTFCLSASRLSFRSASAIASAELGLSCVIPRSLTGMFVSEETIIAIVLSMSE